jgi:hypothetical protein
VARVTMVTWDQETATTLQTGPDDEGRNPWLCPWLLSMGLLVPVPCTSWTVTIPLWGKGCTCAQWGLVTSTVHPATTRCFHAWMFSSLIVGMRHLGWLKYPGYDRWPYPGPICRTNDLRRSGNPASLLLHNISNKLGRHIWPYASAPQ